VQSFFFIRQEGRNVKVDHHDILYIEARKNYTHLVLVDRTAMVLITLKQWEKILPQGSFCRVHRGYIVSIGRMMSFDNKFVYLPGVNIPIGEQYKSALPEMVTIVAPESSVKRILADLQVY
jgi:two-component system LytT family response regulator